MSRISNHNQEETPIIVKVIFLVLTIIFLSVDFLPNYLGHAELNKIELTQTGDQETESNEKEIEKDDFKDYLFTSTNIGKERVLANLIAKSIDPALFNHLYIDVYTPPPEQCDYPAC